jgi:hypothetical protein
MARLSLVALALLGWALTAAEVFALGSDHPKGPVSGNELWPAGLAEVASHPDRVHGFWVNETDVFFYNGDSKAFNEFMDGYSKLKGAALRVVLHPGTKKARSPWDKTDRDPVAWSLTGSSRPLNEFGAQKAGSRYYTRVDVWLGSQVKPEELRIPAHVEVLSGGEIEKFIAERQGQQKK